MLFFLVMCTSLQREGAFRREAATPLHCCPWGHGRLASTTAQPPPRPSSMQRCWHLGWVCKQLHEAKVIAGGKQLFVFGEGRGVDVTVNGPDALAQGPQHGGPGGPFDLLYLREISYTAYNALIKHYKRGYKYIHNNIHYSHASYALWMLYEAATHYRYLHYAVSMVHYRWALKCKMWRRNIPWS